MLKDLVEGPARIVLSQPPGGAYVKSIRAQGKDVTDSPLDLHSGDRIQGVEVVIATNGAQLSGTVKEGTNGPAVSGRFNSSLSSRCSAGWTQLALHPYRKVWATRRVFTSRPGARRIQALRGARSRKRSRV